MRSRVIAAAASAAAGMLLPFLLQLREVSAGQRCYVTNTKDFILDCEADSRCYGEPGYSWCLVNEWFDCLALGYDCP
jgi:hypothetical protein